MSSSRMFWPAGRSLFRKRSRGGLGVAAVSVCLVAGLAAVAVSTWPV